jgi:hypothetical protein
MSLTTHDKQAMRSLLDFCKTSLADYGGCDHRVNICFCGAARDIETVANALHRLTNGEVGWASVDQDVATTPRNMSEVLSLFGNHDVPSFMAGQPLEMD